MSIRHKNADVIIAAAEGKVIQYRANKNRDWRDFKGEEVFNLLSFSIEGAEYRIKPIIVKRWKWAYAIADGGHEYEYVSNKYYTEEEATAHFSVIKDIWKQKIDVTEKEFTE